MFEYELEQEVTTKEFLVVDFRASNHSVFTERQFLERYTWMGEWVFDAQVGEFNKNNQLLFIRIS